MKNELPKNERRIQIKVQSVTTVDAISSPDGLDASTIGDHVDRLLADMVRAKQMPNRISIDLNPPQLPNDSEMPQL